MLTQRLASSYRLAYQLRADVIHFKPKPWRCGDPFRSKLDKPVGDPWAILLQSSLNEDKARCEIWKEEVQNLLISVTPAFVADGTFTYLILTG